MWAVVLTAVVPLCLAQYSKPYSSEILSPLLQASLYAPSTGSSPATSLFSSPKSPDGWAVSPTSSSTAWTGSEIVITATTTVPVTSILTLVTASEIVVTSTILPAAPSTWVPLPSGATSSGSPSSLPTASGASSVPLPSASSGLPTLAEALAAAGCNDFSEFLQSDPYIWTKVNSDSIGTVFCPPDPYYNLTHAVTGLRRRDSDNQRAAEINTSNGQTNLAATVREAVFETSDPDANIGKNASVVPISAENSPSKRSSASGAEYNTSLSIVSGLGDSVNVLYGDIEYQNVVDQSLGYLHVTTGLFTLPQLVSRTAEIKNLSTFNSLVRQAGLTTVFDNSTAITAFVPTDAAFAAAGISASTCDSGLARLLLDHLVVGQVEYSTLLRSGQVLGSQGGLALDVTVEGRDYFVNGVRIEQTNVITYNGVLHIVDQVLANIAAPSGSASLSSSLSGSYPITADGACGPYPTTASVSGYPITSYPPAPSTSTASQAPYPVSSYAPTPPSNPTNATTSSSTVPVPVVTAAAAPLRVFGFGAAPRAAAALVVAGFFLFL